MRHHFAIGAVLAMMAGGCAPEDATWGPDAAPLDFGTLEGTEEVPPGARRAVVLSATPFVTGPTTFTATGLNPGETVHFLRSTSAGVACPGVLGGLCLDIQNPQMLNSAVADAAGTATLGLNIPGPALGLDLHVQAVAIRGAGGAQSVKSNPINDVVVAPGSMLTVGDLGPGDLVITEIMQNPNAVGDSSGEWFEVYNASGFDVDLDGLEMSDLGSDNTTVSGALVVSAGAYVVMGTNIDIATNGGAPVDYDWTGFTLGNSDDEIVLSYLGTVFDMVSWDGGPVFPDPTGASMQLTSTLIDDVSNDDGLNWCEPLAAYGTGDLGTPGTANEDCGVVAPTETCSDGIQNQDETNIDCGGVCQACAGGNPSYLQDEDFESGDFSVFPWVQTGINPWQIESDPAYCYAGSYCMRTNIAHGLGETAVQEISMSIRDAADISFWASTNTENDEHYFRFYIDGVMELELTGQTGWNQYTFPVAATGANGTDRVFTFEYVRSTFMDAYHTPWNEVWIDDIDFPEWNTQPTVPVLDAPGDMAIVTAAPTFEWQAVDPDFDAVTYEFQWDTDPTFANPLTTGETYDDFAMPVLADGVWFWRVRSKDDSDYRWSAWSAERSLEVDSTYEVPYAWSQRNGDQFAMNTLNGATVSGDSIVGGAAQGAYQSTWFSVSQTWDYTFTGLPAAANGSGNIQLCVDGDLDNASGNEYIDYVQLDGVTVYSGNWYPYTLNYACTDIAVDLTSYVGDGTVDVRVVGSPDVGSYYAEVWLEYDVANSEMVTTGPITFDDFPPTATVWEKVQWVGNGATVTVLDGAGTPLPDVDLPGNSAGFTANTIHLWEVDPVAYPVLILQADLIGQLDEWRVTANDGFEWTFRNAGDAEGWIAVDAGAASPVLTVAGDLLVFDGFAGGTDPHIEYWFDDPIDASRFSAVDVRLRSSNNYFNDDPTLYWASNFGAYDSRRSIEIPQVFLYTFMDLTFDLTVVPALPDEPWQGSVESIRLDPVVEFLDQVGLPADGWFEIESIKLR